MIEKPLVNSKEKFVLELGGVSGLFDAQGEHGLHEGSVGEGLGIVPEVVVGGRVHLLGDQSERAGERDELVDQLPGFALSPRGRERLSQPKRAGEKRAFAAR
jgi:hypothetical protein